MNIKQIIKITGIISLAFSLSTCHPWQWEDLPRVNPECPLVASLSPSRAPFDSIVTVFGLGFDAENKSQFKLSINGQEVPILDMQDSTSLRFRVPIGIGSGEVKVSRDGGSCSAVAPNIFNYIFTGTNSTVFATQLNHPIGLDVDDHGNVFVANRNSHNIKMIPKTGGSGSVIAGSASGEFGWISHPNGTSARFIFPTDVALTTSGVIYVADEGNNCIRKIDGENTSREVSTVVGQPDPSGDNTFGDITYPNVKFTSPRSIATDRNGKLYITEPSTQNLRVIDETAHTVRKIQINGTAPLNYPFGVAFSIARGNSFPVFVANHDSRLVQGINPLTGSSVVIASASIFSVPTDLVLDDEGVMYVLDRGSKKVFILYQNGTNSFINIASSTVNPNTLAGIGLDKRNRILYVSDETLNMIYKIELK